MVFVSVAFDLGADKETIKIFGNMDVITPTA